MAKLGHFLKYLNKNNPYKNNNWQERRKVYSTADKLFKVTVCAFPGAFERYSYFRSQVFLAGL
jgi:hypothetical protein